MTSVSHASFAVLLLSNNKVSGGCCIIMLMLFIASPVSSLTREGISFSDLVAQRGERLELLIDKTESLVDSVSFHSLDAPGRL